MTPQEKTILDATMGKIQKDKKANENRNGRITLWALAALTASLVFNGVQGYSLAKLYPLKTIEPMIAVIDSETGIMTSVEKFDSKTDPKMIERLVTSYFWTVIKSRYGYNGRIGRDSLAEQYMSGAIFLDGKDRTDFENEVSALNLNSPFNLLGENGSVTPKIISINLLGNNKVQATFRTMVVKGTDVKQYSYTLTADYKTGDYTNLSVKDRYANIFGVKFFNWNLTQNASNDALVSVNQSAVAQPLPQAPVNAASEPQAVTNSQN